MGQSSSPDYSTVGSLKVEPSLKSFVEDELLPDLNIQSDEYWEGVERIITELCPENGRLLDKREELQADIDGWHSRRKGDAWDSEGYLTMLRETGYLVSEGEEFAIRTTNVDAEIATVAGPQLVVPVSNARFALNAANARWGSLYDALYGSDIIDESDGKTRSGGYNPKRGDAVIAYAARFLDQALPLKAGSHADVQLYKLHHHDDVTSIEVLFNDGESVLEDPEQFIGHAVNNGRLTLLFKNNNLHIELFIDDDHPVGRDANAHLADVILESAVTTIQDCEDSVAAVDAEDKVGVYRNWLGLMRGTLSASFQKGTKTLERVLAKDRRYLNGKGGETVLSGRSLLLVRNVGHLMTNNAILDADGKEVPEGILDAIITSTCALYDLRKEAGVKNSRNSRTGSVYIVKPKMHGPHEVAFTDRLFAHVEDLLGMPRYTLKVGVMDEERRTTVNLKECIRAVKDRLVFINTGFLDRTGDEIHTSMHAGPMLPKDLIKSEPWIDAYERWNVDVGIRCGLPGVAQIGKGMWPKPDELKEMVETKQAHLEAGANCAWVPSPTAATLHAMHYHQIDVFSKQRELITRDHAKLADILTPPLAPRPLTDEEVSHELRNSCQTILGYVVRWIDQGVGCSKVPDMNDVGLMEDRATLRISSQLLANWLHHGVCSKEQVVATMQEMAAVVDRQNAADPQYEVMGDILDTSIAFAAACDLVLLGEHQPSGYTEPLLHKRRLEKKANA
ncbi:MAG: malate synthase G [Gammaproteobacteria bacterium]